MFIPSIRTLMTQPALRFPLPPCFPEGNVMQAKKLRLLMLITVLSLVLSFGAALPVPASAENAAVGKILTTISATPVALTSPSQITAATSTPGCRVISAGWYDAGGMLVSGDFGPETYTLVLVIGVTDGYTISPDVACYLNNSAISCSVDPSGTSATLTRDYTASVWAPTVYKHPGNETVDEGGWASFVVSGSYVRDYEWSLMEPEGRGIIPVDRLKDSYPSIEYKGNNSPKLNLYHIPYALNGWKVVCDMIGAGEGNVTRTNPAVLTVNPTISRIVAAPQPSTEVSPAPSPEPVSATAPVTSAVTTPADAQEHRYSEAWSYDARGHWRESLDGSPATDEALHSFNWTSAQDASGAEVERGVCEICGYTATRRLGGAASGSAAGTEAAPAASSGTVSVPVLVESSSASGSAGGSASGAEGSGGFRLSALKPPSVLMALLMALLPVDLVLVIVHLCGPARQRRRRRRRR